MCSACNFEGPIMEADTFIYERKYWKANVKKDESVAEG
jgi:hypothetical protein